MHRKRCVRRSGAKFEAAPIRQGQRKRSVRDAPEQAEHGARGERQQAKLEILHGNRSRLCARGASHPAAGGIGNRGDGTVHRLTSSAGGTGLEKNGTRLAQRRSACQ